MGQPSGHDIINGSVERVTFHAEDTGYSILKVRLPDRRDPATVLGNTPVINAGESITAEGSWVEVPEYGRQFKADRIESAPPVSREGIERFLGSGLIHGIGPVYAKKLVKKFGDEVFDIIDQSSKRLEDVDGIGKKRRLEIKASWEKQKALRSIMVFLFEHGVGTARALRIHKTYGDEAVDVLRKNPYQLTRDIHGVGFKTADEIARKLGLDGAAAQRIEAGIFHQLQTASDQGHAALTEDDLLRESAELLGVPGDQVEASLEALVDRDELKRDTPGSGEALVYLPPLLYAEKGVAGRMRELAGKSAQHPDIDAKKALEWCQAKSGVTLADAQAEAVTEALRNRVLIITGGPGVGKTTILRGVLDILTAKQVDAVLAAPTGRAAKRLSESCGFSASTIHRLLEYAPVHGFARNAERPLDGDLFIVDEASMIDLPLMHAFLRALPANAHLLLVGDVDQLPSVGPGSVLRDLIDSGVVPSVRLTQIFRQSGDSRIVEVAHEINEGRLPDLAPPAKLPTENLKLETPPCDFHFIERDSPERIAETIAHLVRDRLPERFGLDPFRDIQVLTPMNRNALGTVALNKLLQARLNPENELKFEVDRFGVTYRVGDKVIQSRNNYDKEVFNGDIGVITRIEADPVSIHVRFDETRVADYEPGELDELRLAYAITIHKSQGSEFPAVVIPVSGQHYIMLQRNLIYTGITRGKQLVILVGEAKALAMAVRNVDQAKRVSALRERMEGNAPSFP